jgi:hypothetical protein
MLLHHANVARNTVFTILTLLGEQETACTSGEAACSLRSQGFELPDETAKLYRQFVEVGSLCNCRGEGPFAAHLN